MEQDAHFVPVGRKGTQKPRYSRVGKSARADLRRGRSAMVVPTATTDPCPGHVDGCPSTWRMLPAVAGNQGAHFDAEFFASISDTVTSFGPTKCVARFCVSSASAFAP